jgi:hypothetical protein
MSNKPTEVDIALGILDHQLVDADGQNCGKVDDLEIAGINGGAPEVGTWPPGSRGMPCTCPGRRSSRSPRSSR